MKFLPVPPKITSDLSIRDMTVIAGEPFTITVPYTANPKPRPSWSINGEEVLTGDRIKFDTTDVASQFINKKAKRSDTGTYTIYLTNTVGTDSASCKVLVVGKHIFRQLAIYLLELFYSTKRFCSQTNHHRHKHLSIYPTSLPKPARYLGNHRSTMAVHLSRITLSKNWIRLA